MRGYSDAIGSFTFTIMSALAQTSSTVGTIVPPARSYSGSSKLEPAPASVSTRTLWPASVSARTPAGVRPTRYSLSLISLGRPMITFYSPGRLLRLLCGLGCGRFDRVNLCALQLATEVDVNRLPFREDVQHLRSCFTMPVASRFSAAERKVHFSADG